MEKSITFNCEDIRLEGRLVSMSPTKAAVVTHPHPLYGGDMDNTVVGIISTAYHNIGWSTLRFNFRGTGGSQGRFDDGRGEQADVDAAIAYLTAQGIQEIELAGYSFGAWVLALREHERNLYPLRLVAPPVAFTDFKQIQKLETLKQVVVGTNDEFAPLNQVESRVKLWNEEVEFNVIEKADHFYWNQLEELQTVLEAAIEKNRIYLPNSDLSTK